MLVNVMARNLVKIDVADREDVNIFRAVMAGLAASTVVGGTQAAWTLLKQPYVHKSRTFINVSTLPRAKLQVRVKTVKQLKESVKADGATADIFDASPSSNLGRRNVYEAFVKQQNSLGEGVCTVTFHCLNSNYNFTAKPATKGRESASDKQGGKTSDDSIDEREDDDHEGSDAEQAIDHFVDEVTPSPYTAQFIFRFYSP